MSEAVAVPEHVRRRRHRVARLRGAIAVLLALAVVGGGIGFVVVKGKNALAAMVDQQRDYDGSGTGKVTVRIEKGSSLSAMGSTLADAGVVFNADAFVRAANKNDDAATIQPGTYTMKSKMSGAAAVTALLSPRNRVVVKVTIPEGTRAVDIYAILAKKSGLPVKDFRAAAAKPADLGLPSYAKSVEGYLFPATYTFEPNSSADVMLRAMASRYLDEAEKLGLANRRQAPRPHGEPAGDGGQPGPGGGEPLGVLRQGHPRRVQPVGQADEAQVRHVGQVRPRL